MKQIYMIFFLLPVLLNAYTFSGGKDNVAQLIASKVLEKAYTRAEIKIKPIFLPPQESLEQSNTGITDGELARIKNITKLYPNLRQVPVQIVSVEAVAFSKDTSLKIQSWNDLRGHSVTIIKGAKFIEIGTKNIPRKLVLSFHEAFEALHNGETDIVVAPKLAGIRLNFKKEYTDIKAISPALQKKALYHFVHKKNSHLIPIITPILQKMKESGEIEYIGKAYLRGIAK